MEPSVGSVVVYLLLGFVLGGFTRVVASEKGYSESWFGQGFCFGLWGLSPPVDSRTEGHDAISSLSGNRARAKANERCLCGKLNPADLPGQNRNGGRPGDVEE